MAKKTWQDKGLHHAPDERAAQAANEEDEKEEQSQDDTIEIDGEKYSRKDAVDALKNKSSWERSLKQKDQMLAESRKTMESVVNKVLEGGAKPPAQEEPEEAPPGCLQDVWGGDYSTGDVTGRGEDGSGHHPALAPTGQRSSG